MFNWDFNQFYFLTLAETTVSISHVTFPGSDVSLESQCGCRIRFFSKLCMYVCGRQKS